MLDFFRGLELVKFTSALVSGIYLLAYTKGLGSARRDAWTLERQIICSIHEAGCFISPSVMLEVWKISGESLVLSPCGRIQEAGLRALEWWVLSVRWRREGSLASYFPSRVCIWTSVRRYCPLLVSCPHPVNSSWKHFYRLPREIGLLGDSRSHQVDKRFLMSLKPYRGYYFLFFQTRFRLKVQYIACGLSPKVSQVFRAFMVFLFFP